MMRHKMKFKKLLAVALIITMMSSLLGCSYSKKSDSSASGGGASSGSSTSTLQNIIKNGKSLALEVYPEKSIYVKPNLGRINVPVFFIKTPINRGIFEEIFGETLKS